MPRQPLEATDRADTIHQFVGMIEADSLLPLLDSDSNGYESSGSYSAAVEVFMANTASGTPAGAGGLPQPTTSEEARAQAHEKFMRIPITGDSLAERALEAQRQALLNESARLVERQRATERQPQGQAGSSQQHQRPPSPFRQPGTLVEESLHSRGHGATSSISRPRTKPSRGYNSVRRDSPPRGE